MKTNDIMSNHAAAMKKICMEHIAAVGDCEGCPLFNGWNCKAGGKYPMAWDLAAQKKETSLKQLGLSVRAYNALRRGGINTVEELAELEPKKILKIRGCGYTVLGEVVEKLRECGMGGN